MTERLTDEQVLGGIREAQRQRIERLRLIRGVLLPTLALVGEDRTWGFNFIDFVTEVSGADDEGETQVAYLAAKRDGYIAGGTIAEPARINTHFYPEHPEHAEKVRQIADAEIIELVDGRPIDRDTLAELVETQIANDANEHALRDRIREIHSQQ